MRARNIKPKFFKDEKVLKCTPLARILFEGLWCYADREGRFEWNPFEIKLEILPADECDIGVMMNELKQHRLILKYSVNGNDYGVIPKFLNHQNPHPHEAKSKCPKPPDDILKQDKCNNMSGHVNDMSSNDTECIAESLNHDTRNHDIKDVGVDTPPLSNTKDEILTEATMQKITQEIDKIVDQLYQDKIFPDAPKFKNTMFRQNKNPRAVLHALIRCSLIRPPADEAWAYCTKIIKTENGNYNEKDFRKTQN